MKSLIEMINGMDDNDELLAALIYSTYIDSSTDVEYIKECLNLCLKKYPGNVKMFLTITEAKAQIHKDKAILYEIIDKYRMLL